MTTQQLIDKIQHALHQGDYKEVVKYDTALNYRKNSALNTVAAQAALHNDQMDYIFKWKALTSTKTGIIIVTLAGLSGILDMTSGFHYWLNIVLIVALGLALLLRFRPTADAEHTMKALEKRMNVEKRHHIKVLEEIDVISEFQLKTESKISPMYERYEQETS